MDIVTVYGAKMIMGKVMVCTIFKNGIIARVSAYQIIHQVKMQYGMERAV